MSSTFSKKGASVSRTPFLLFIDDRSLLRSFYDRNNSSGSNGPAAFTDSET